MLDQVVSTFLFAFASFIPVLNPFGGAMFFLALTPNIDQETRKMMVNRIVFYSMIIMLISLFAGHLILSFFGISMGVLRVGGGLVLISAGWKATATTIRARMLMVNKEAQQNRTRTVSPAAIPSKANYRVKSKKHL